MTATQRPPRTFTLIGLSVLVVGTFAVLGVLSTPRLLGLGPLIAMGALGTFVGGLATLGMTGVLILLYPKVTRRRGWRAVAASVLRSFLLLIPYAVLALVARALLRWDAAGAFTAAGVMTACTAVGAELARLGGSKLTSMLLPMLAGSALSTTWLGITSLVVTLIAGGGP